MAEPRPRRGDRAAPLQQAERRLERDPAKRHDDSHAWERGDFRVEVAHAGVDLVRRRLVRGRRAADRGHDVRIAKLEPVVDAPRGWNAREPRPIERRHQEVTRAVAREDAAGSVGAVRGGRETDDQQPRRGIAEARDRTSPVHLVAVRAFLFESDAAAVLPQTRTTIAGDNRVANGNERRGWQRR
jgi:hypothetical protein